MGQAAPGKAGRGSGSSGSWPPSRAASQPIQALRARAVLVDMEEGVVGGVLRGPLGELFDSRQLLTDCSGAGNNWAHGFGHYGPQYHDQLLDTFRVQVGQRAETLLGAGPGRAGRGGAGPGRAGHICSAALPCTLLPICGSEGAEARVHFLHARAGRCCSCPRCALRRRQSCPPLALSPSLYVSSCQSAVINCLLLLMAAGGGVRQPAGLHAAALPGWGHWQRGGQLHPADAGGALPLAGLLCSALLWLVCSGILLFCTVLRCAVLCCTQMAGLVPRAGEDEPCAAFALSRCLTVAALVTERTRLGMHPPTCPHIHPSFPLPMCPFSPPEPPTVPACFSIHVWSPPQPNTLPQLLPPGPLAG